MSDKAPRNDVDAEMWEISENLHRAELKKLDRDEQVSRWIALREKKRVLFQSEAKTVGRPESGVRAASRELGIEQADAHRATKVAGLTEEAKAWNAAGPDARQEFLGRIDQPVMERRYA